MRTLIAFPVLILAVILQSAVISRITLLAGCADLMLVILAAWALQTDIDASWQWASWRDIGLFCFSNALAGCFGRLPRYGDVGSFVARARLAGACIGYV